MDANRFPLKKEKMGKIPPSFIPTQQIPLTGMNFDHYESIDARFNAYYNKSQLLDYIYIYI